MTGGEENAFILQTDQENFENAPDVDVNTILPALGEPTGDWDLDIRNYWEGGVVPGTPSTDTTAVPATTGTVSPDATASPGAATAMPEATGATTGALQGVVLATEVLGSNITVGMNGVVLESPDSGQALAQGTPAATAMPATTGTPSTDLDDTDQMLDVVIDDLIVETTSGAIQYVVVSTSFDDGEHWIPVPLDLLRWDANNGAFVLDVDPTMLQGAPFFTDGEYPDTTVEGWDSEFSTYWP